MRFPFSRTAAPVVPRQPEPMHVPKMIASDIAALYRAARVGGDFFDSVQVGPERLVFCLLDIAGKREQALGIATDVQRALHKFAPELFSGGYINEADAVTELVLRLNNAILAAAGGVRCAPGFVACYNESLGILSYVNAGHVPALVRDGNSISVLEASGLPLGLFSHATHDCQLCVLPPGAALLIASRGLLEVRSGGEEYGIGPLKENLQSSIAANAHDLCESVLRNVADWAEQQNRTGFRALLSSTHSNGEGDSLGENDITAVALVRASALTRAKSSAAAR